MKRAITIALTMALFSGIGLAEPGMELTLSHPFASVANPAKPILSLSWFTPRLSGVPGYDELGVTVMPSWGGESKANPLSEGVEEWVGLYAGHLFLPGRGWVRPGMDFGWIWQKARQVDQAGEEQLKEGFAFYYGVKVQVLCLTFLLSNNAFGGGINFSL